MTSVSLEGCSCWRGFDSPSAAGAAAGGAERRELPPKALEESVQSDVRMQSLLYDLGGEIDLVLMDHGISPGLRSSDLGVWSVARREIQYYRLLRAMYQSSRQREDEPVFVPYLDYCAHVIGMRGSPFGSAPWSGIVMRQAFHHEAMGVSAPRVGWAGLKKTLFERLLGTAHLKALFSIDETLVEYYKCRDEFGRPGVTFLPEPGEIEGKTTRKEARAQLGIPESAHVVLVYGELRRRKGVDALLDAAACPGFPENTHILLAGPQLRETRALLVKPTALELRSSGRLHEDDRILAGEEEYRAFVASDAVWLGYRGHYGMSAVLIQAAKMKLPVIACRDGLLGHHTRNAELGITVDIDSPSTVARRLAALSSDSSRAQKQGENGATFFADRNVARFSEVICRELFEVEADNLTV